jgi:ABC-type transporter Mla maintaining outer membrane lipid asymmetry ATPase subunit MlaF
VKEVDHQIEAKDRPVIELTEGTLTNPLAPNVVVLRNINWRVEPNDFWVIAGLQGSGKSVLLETAAGLRPLLKGHLRLFGTPIQERKGDAFLSIRQRIALVFEAGGRLFRQLTVSENVALPVRYNRNCSLEDASTEAHAAMVLAGVDQFADLPANVLSPSWAQRVALARAIVMRPEVLMLDNPLVGADSTHTRWWRGLLEAFASGHPYFDGRSLTLIVACENLRPWRDLGRQFALAHEGKWDLLGGRQEAAAASQAVVRDLLEVTY